MRALIAGWFSFEQMGATAGDLLARDLVAGWLAAAGVDCDLAVAPPFAGGVDWREVDPAAYSHVVFVCGPFGNGWPVTDFLERFSRCRRLGVNLSMLESLERWNPFDLLLERDSSRAARPDLTFLAAIPAVPVAGIVLVHPQEEYGERARHDHAHRVIRRLVAGREMAAVEIDTRLDDNRTGLRTPAEVESLIARMDAVVTTRLHGLVMALKHGVPAVAVDPVAGGAKIRRQAETLGWPLAFTIDEVSDAALAAAFDQCLTPGSRERARRCGARARELLSDVRDELVAGFPGAGG